MRKTPLLSMLVITASLGACGQSTASTPTPEAPDESKAPVAAQPDQSSQANAEATSTESPAVSTSIHYLVNVEGMHCENCARVVRMALEDLDGVESANVDHASGTVDVAMKEQAELDPAKVSAALEGTSFKATGVERQ